ncbi:MAG: DUF4375 domain-containing protein [Pedobacter sp.]|jgi:hypothetical protein|uniref:DMP19 family protein n=1 Tax=Pedobacter sp. TaxID=1411316 RepID=UPI0035651EFA
MKRHLYFILFLSLLSCKQVKNDSKNIDNKLRNQFKVFDASNHLQPLFDKPKFDTLHDWDFGWAVLEPINISKNPEEEKILSKRLSPGQKALYFFWYLNDEVTNGGFIQFYWNDYRKYLPSINDGMKLIGDTSMLNLIGAVDKDYVAQKGKFDIQKQNDDLSPLYENLKNFDKYDSVYYSIHDKTMRLIEKYAKEHPEEFVKFK